MTTALRYLNREISHGAAWFNLLAVLVLLPGLLFSDYMPSWVPLAALAGLLFLFGLQAAASGHVFGQTPLDWSLLLLLLSVAASLWITPERAASLPRAYTLMANLALFWVVAGQPDAPWLRWSGWLLLLGGLILGSVFLLGTQFVSTGSTTLTFIDREIYTRLPGGWRPFWNQEGFHTNLSAGLLALFWLPALVLVWTGDSWQQRDVAKLVTGALAVLLVLAQSRGALLGAAVAVAIVSSLWNRRWLLLWLVVVVGMVAGAFSLGPEGLLEMALGPSDVLDVTSLRGRQELWQRGLAMVRDSPLTGVGLGMVDPMFRQLYPTLLLGPDKVLKHTHNIYLQAAAETGLVGLIAHLSLYLSLLALLIRRVLDRTAGQQRTLALALLGSLIVFLTHGLFEVITFAPRAAIVVWGLFGLMVAISTSSTGKRETG
jgi:putative inorganic carbon (hco3(-)) transporter